MEMCKALIRSVRSHADTADALQSALERVTIAPYIHTVKVMEAFK